MNFKRRIWLNVIDWMKFESFFFKFYPKSIFRIYFIKYKKGIGGFDFLTIFFRRKGKLIYCTLASVFKQNLFSCSKSDQPLVLYLKICRCSVAIRMKYYQRNTRCCVYLFLFQFENTMRHDIRTIWWLIVGM